MEPTFYEIDPNGDTLLILHNANAPFAPLPSSEQQKKQKPSDSKPGDKTTEELKDAGDKPEDTDTELTAQMKLSSKHLILASVYFQKLTANNWKETTPKDGYSYVIDAFDWDEQALLILMNIIHGRTAKVPRSVSLEMLAKIAVLVDYYQCHETVDFFAQTWLSSTSITIPKEGERDFMLRLVVSVVFSENFNFLLATKVIIQHSNGPIDSLDLPIEQGIIDDLNTKREEAIRGVLDGIRSLRKKLGGDQKTCSFECSSINLGALLKFMTKMGLIDPFPKAPFPGLSLSKLEHGLLFIKEPSWKTNCRGIPPSEAASTNPAPAQVSGLFALPSTRILPAQTAITPTPAASLFNTSTGTGSFSFGTAPAPRAASPLFASKLAAPTTTAPNPACTLSANTKPIVDSLLSKLNGLRLTDYIQPQ